MFHMYVHLLFGISSIIPIILSAGATDSEFTFPFDEWQQPDLTNIPSDPLDSATSLFDIDITPSQILEGVDSPLLEQTDPNSSELAWDDPFQLADCSSSENSFLPVTGKSRVRRIDNDSSGCTNPDAAASGANPSSDPTPIFFEQKTFDKEKHSITCYEATLGLLPFAVLASPDKNDKITDTSKSIDLPFPFVVSYVVTTLYRVTPCKRRNPAVSFDLVSLLFLSFLPLLLIAHATAHATAQPDC